MNNLGEQSFPVPSEEVFRPGVDIQPRDQLDAVKMQRPQDTLRLGDNLTIPPTSLCAGPESPDPCMRNTCDPVSHSFSAPMHSSNGEPLFARNVVVFGESGVGKSSVINMIAGEKTTQTSNNAIGCTFLYRCYHVSLDGLSLNIWDTVGLDEGTEGKVPAARAENSLKAFLRQITEYNGIDLLLYCVRGTRVRQALLRNYNIFYAAICRKKVPVALVVTGLENYEEDMEAWWTEHERDLIKHGMRFDAHACVTTMQSDHPAIQDRLRHSRHVLRNLVRAKFDAITWKADGDSLISASLPDVRALLQASEKLAAPLIMISDTTGLAARVRHFQTMTESQATYINDRLYRCLHVDVDVKRMLPGDSKHCVEIMQRPDLLIFFADADAELDRTWTTFEQFHASSWGETCPIIVVFGGLDNYEAAVKAWGSLSSSRTAEIIASPTFYPRLDSPREMLDRADEALAALIEERCLTRFEERPTRFQKFCRHSKSFFTGRM